MDDANGGGGPVRASGCHTFACMCRMFLRTALLGIRMSLRTELVQTGDNNLHRRREK